MRARLRRRLRWRRARRRVEGLGMAVTLRRIDAAQIQIDTDPGSVDGYLHVYNGTFDSALEAVERFAAGQEAMGVAERAEAPSYIPADWLNGGDQ